MNSNYFRITYNGIGIYEALKKKIWSDNSNFSKENWINFKNSAYVNWLKVPNIYGNNYYSYFTELGFNIFMKKTYPLIIKYLEEENIHIEKYFFDIEEIDLIYSDEHQIVINIKEGGKDMKKIVFATTNPTKAKRFSKELSKYDIEVLSLKDLSIELENAENGTNAIENALIKARECYELTKMPSIGMDDTLYLENVPEYIQPGLFVRRVNGKTLNDEEMIEHYTKLVKEYGVDGRLNCKWIYGLAVIDESGKENTYTWYKDDFYMVDTISDKINPRYPLNSISKYKGIDKYFTDVTDEDIKLIKYNEDDVVEFIKEHI